MARVDPQSPLLASLIDRLIDHEPDVSTEPAWRQSQSLREFEASVLRDIEALLNTRQVRSDLPSDLPHSAQSVLSFGLPDFSSCGVGSLEDREQLRSAVEQAIARFEPRLRDVRVTLHDKENELDRTLHLTIDGLLWVQPDPLPVAFDTLVKPASGQCIVKQK